MEFIDLKAQYNKLKKQINENIENVLEQGNYIMGNEVKVLEEKLAKYVGIRYCATCGNGTDALTIALMALDIKEGDAVFVPSFTFYASAEVVSFQKATPIFIDSDKRTFNIDVKKLEKAILEVKKENKLKPKAIIAVDLFGLPANYTEIRKIADRYNLKIIEDGAQGFGGSINGKKACSFGDVSITSFFPAKPLGCYGDGGAIFTDSEELYNLITSIRVHGKGTFKYDNVRVGVNSRLDTLQAAILIPKLEAFEKYELENRNKWAKEYTNILQNYVKTPLIPENFVSSWAQYTLILETEKERNYLQEKLKEAGIPTNIYYPKPLHKQVVYQDYNFNIEDLEVSENLSKTVLSIPMHPYLTKEIIKEVCSTIIKYVGEYRNEK